EHLVDDRLRMFVTRIVAGDDRHIGSTGSPSQQRPLGAVTIAAGTEDTQHPALGEIPYRADRPRQRVVGMGVVDEYVELLPGGDPLQPSGNRLQISDPLGDVLQ